MASPLPTTGGRHGDSEPNAWQELEDVFAALGQLARSSVAPPEFYRTVLDESVRALSAVGGAVWLRGSGGTLQPLVQNGWPREQFASDENRRGHEALLIGAAAEERILRMSPRSSDGSGEGTNPTSYVLLVAPVTADTSRATQKTAHTYAIVELLLQPDANPSSYRGSEQFLTAVCELAADYHAFHELERLRGTEDCRNQLLALGPAVHRALSLSETAYAVANQGRGVVGCDRLSVLVARGRKCKLLATSGVSRVEHRSGAARRLAQVAEQVRRTDEPAYYADGHSDGLPPVADALEQHAEESHARQIAAIPLRRPTEPLHNDSQLASKRSGRTRRERPQFVLIAEQFDARGLERDRLAEVAEVCTTALYNAWEFDRLPLGWLLRPLAAVKNQVTAHLPRTLFVITAMAAGVAALVLVPADFNVETAGTLQPAEQRDVFAPRSGIVDEVLVTHGQSVNKGQELVRLRDPSLDLEIKRVDGELETARQQLDAVRATRTNRAVRDENPTDAYRLSAEERELQQQLANLRCELELLRHEQDGLVVTAPIAGQVLTWDLSHRLSARPVERGEVLVTVADLADEWQLELEVPDDRIGYVLAAQQKLEPNLPVRFKLTSDDREQHDGQIAEICQTADVKSDGATAPSPTVLVKVKLDKIELSDAGRRELRPGVSARAQIDCGQKPLGYVWLHDIWDTVVEWATF